MAGIRIQNIPNEVTEKQLKVYFSNPKHGGGQIAELLYPMPNNTAVIIYEEAQAGTLDADELPCISQLEDAQQILTKRHRVGDEKLVIKTLPRMVYHSGQVVLDKHVSEFISRKPDVVDELQFMGELKVDFSYEQEAYIFTATWYKLEWAMQYLDNMLDVYGFDDKATAGALEDDDESIRRARNQDIKHANIPSMPKEFQDHKKESDWSEVDKNKAESLDAIAMLSSSKQRKYKNIPAPKAEESIQAGENAAVIPGGMRPNILPRNVQPNIPNKAMKNKPSMEQGVGRKAGEDKPGALGRKNVGDWLSNNGPFMNKQEGFGWSPDSPKKSSVFDPTFGFEGMFERQMFPQQRFTKGIDVSAADFGDTPTSFVFDASIGLRVVVAKDDITKQDTDCIVNGTSSDLANQYGISRAIVKAVGPRLQADCVSFVRSNGPLKISKVMHTAAGGHLNPKVHFILHTAGPKWSERRSEEVTHSLVCTYINCLQYASLKLQVRSVAMPLISAGNYGFPLDVCVQAFYDAILLLTVNQSQRQSLKEIRLVCFDEGTTTAVIVLLQSLQDCDVHQMTGFAVERYQSNVSQYGVGADNFALPFENPQGKRDRPVPAESGQDRQEKNKLDKESEVQNEDKLDDTSDTESQDDDGYDADAERYERKDVPVAGRRGFDVERGYWQMDLGKQASKDAKANKKESYNDSDDEDLTREEQEEEEAEEEEREVEKEKVVEEKSTEESEASVAVLRDSFKSGSMTKGSKPVQATEKVDSDYDSPFEIKTKAEVYNPSTDDEEDGSVQSDQSDKATEQLDDKQVDETEQLDDKQVDETVAKISSLLAKVQAKPEDRTEEGNSSSDNSGAEEDVHIPEELMKEDVSMCDSVGGSMVHVKRQDLDDFSD